MNFSPFFFRYYWLFYFYFLSFYLTGFSVVPFLFILSPIFGVSSYLFEHFIGYCHLIILSFIPLFSVVSQSSFLMFFFLLKITFFSHFCVFLKMVLNRLKIFGLKTFSIKYFLNIFFYLFQFGMC